MRKIKGIIIISLILVIMIMNNVLAVSTFTDVEDTEYEEAVINLVELGIFSKTLNNTFGLNEKVTKAEMARILVKCLALEGSVNAKKGETDYLDISANHNLSGYVNILSDIRVIDIPQNEEFYPDKNITYAEVVTYCIRMLGYGPVVDAKGTWPTNYLLKATELEVSDGVSLKSTDEITRGDLSLILWNTLNTKMWRITSGVATKIETLLEVKFPGAEIYQKKYKVEITDDGNGKVEVDKTEVAEDEDLIITIIPNDGYELYELNVDYRGNGSIRDFSSKVKNGKVTVTCGENDIKIEAIFILIEVIEEPTVDTEEPADKTEQPKEKKIISVRPDMNLEIKDYTGKEQEIIIENFDSEIMTISGNKATNVGKYKAIVSVKDAENYAVSYKGIIGDTVEIEWKIVKTWLLLPIARIREYEYTGKEIELEIHDVSEYKVNISGNKATEVGEYEAIVSIKDKEGYVWADDGSTRDIILKWKIVNSNLSGNDSQNTSTENSSEDETTVEELKTYTTTVIQSKGGEIKTNNIEVEEGRNQTFTIIPDESYKIVDVKVDGKSVGAVSKYTLKNVKKTHKITAVFEEIVQEQEDTENIENEELENQFEDVKSEEWYYEPVKYATTKGLFKGVSNNEFAPNVTMNRAMLVTVLYRLDGEKATKYENKFNDLENGAYYENAVNWATENKIVSGVSEKEFAPSNKITREQLVVMLYRFAELNGKNVNQKADLTSYEDFNEISDYAKEATAWAVKAGYINGRSETILAPKGTATRAEVATILMRFSEN